MDKSLVTETPEELVYNAENDIICTIELLAKTNYPVDRMYNIICFHATQAVEKLLKGFIISSGKTIEKMHDLDSIHQSAAAIDVSFAEIKSECMLLNSFVENIKYSSKNQVFKQDLEKIIKSLETICNFAPIKAMRNSFSKDRKYEIVSEITTGQESPNIPQKGD